METREAATGLPSEAVAPPIFALAARQLASASWSRAVAAARAVTHVAAVTVVAAEVSEAVQVVAAGTTLAAVAEGTAARRTTAGRAARLLSMVRDTRAPAAATRGNSASVAWEAMVEAAIPSPLSAAQAVVAEAATSAEAAEAVEPEARAAGMAPVVVVAAAGLLTLSQVRLALRCGQDGEMRRVTASLLLAGNE